MIFTLSTADNTLRLDSLVAGNTYYYDNIVCRLEETIVPPPSPISTDQDDGAASQTQHQFEVLARQWKIASRRMATVREMVKHPAYREIIGMGDIVVPMILRELEQAPDHWFSALKTITGVNPVPEEHRGDLRSMAEDWTKWGRENGYEW